MKHKIKLSSKNHTIRLPFAFCIVCGKSDGVVVHSFEQEERNPVAAFAKLAGDVSIIAEYILNKPHNVEAPFCRRCFHKFNSVSLRVQILHLLFLVGIFVSILLSIYVHSAFGTDKSVAVFGIGVVLSLAFRIYAKFYKWKYSPSIKKVNKREIILNIPGRGKWVCSR
jgi:putative flippase GtrA